jgi:hypothetical protein
MAAMVRDGKELEFVAHQEEGEGRIEEWRIPESLQEEEAGEQARAEDRFLMKEIVTELAVGDSGQGTDQLEKDKLEVCVFSPCTSAPAEEGWRSRRGRGEKASRDEGAGLRRVRRWADQAGQPIFARAVPQARGEDDRPNNIRNGGDCQEVAAECKVKG